MKCLVSVCMNGSVCLLFLCLDCVLQKLASVSPDLPKLVELLTVHQPKENEILLLGGLEATEACQRCTGVCLLQCSGKRRSTQPGSIIFEINKFLIGLQWGKERQCQQGKAAGQRLDDDTNRSISSIEEDFLTASEHLGDDSEDDGFRNGEYSRVCFQLGKDYNYCCCTQKCIFSKGNFNLSQKPESGDLGESVPEAAQKHCVRLASHRGQLARHQQREDAEVKKEGHQRSSIQTKESAGYYATNLAESVLQDAFIRLSQDETSFASEAAISVSLSSCPPNFKSPSKTKQPSQQRTCSFELPKIVIVQSPDSSDGAAEWPENQVPHVPDHATKTGEKQQNETQVALACAANVIGTITTPQLTEQLAMESASEEDVNEELQEPEDKEEYSFSSAMCGMAQVAGAVAAVDLMEEPGDGGDSDTDPAEIYTASRGLMSAAEASAAFTLHCSVAEGTSVEAFRANIAEVLHREAAEVLTQPQGYRSVAHLLETTHNKIVDGITFSKKSYTDEREVDELINEVADSLFKHALEKAKKKKELEGTGKEAPSFQVFLQDGVNNLLFDILCLTQKKISHISTCDQGSCDTREGDACVKEPANIKEDAKDPLSQLQCLFGHNENLSGSKPTSLPAKDFSDSQQGSGRLGTGSDSRQASLTPQSSLNSFRIDSESRTPITCYADDLASTVVSMATELAAICLENSTGKQPWFCALKGSSAEVPEGYLIPACRTVLRRKEGQNSNSASRKHRAPRLSEIKRKTEEQPELMERLVNRVVDESVNPDEPQDPFALFASEVTARILNCPELNVVDTSKTGQQRSRLQCERWSRGKASSYESIPEEDTDPSGTPNTLGPGSRLGQNLSRGSSISKQSSCESITDEFSRFMVNQMETEGRGFDLLLDYYAGKNASSILAAAVQQAASKKNGHLNVRASSCLSKQSSTESITEEFYRFMLRDMDKENKEYGIAKTKEWSNSLFPPPLRTPFCIRQSSVPDRRSSDSRLTVNSPIKANSFDGFARNVHGDTLNIFPTNSVSATGLCKSDSCLYQRGKTDQITDMLIHETWSSSIESLMRKNKIIADPEDSIDLEAAGDSQPHVQQFANRLAADIVDIGKSALGGQQDVGGGTPGSHPQAHMPVGERRRGFKQSHLRCSRSRSSQEQAGSIGGSDSGSACIRGPRNVPLIHIEGDQRDEETVLNPERTGGHQEVSSSQSDQSIAADIVDILRFALSSSDRDRTAVAAVVKREKRSMSASSEESMGSWSHITPEDDPHEETSSFIHLSEGSVTAALLIPLQTLLLTPSPRSHWPIATNCVLLCQCQFTPCRSSIHTSRTAGDRSIRELLVVNCDLEPECMDLELRVALQWIAASELGLPALYFRKSKEKRVAKFLRVVHLMSQKAWRIADLFDAVVQFCKMHEKAEEAGKSLQSSLFDWLLETL
uniref:SPHK1 interactor, AKAP domain containing n=1 Tax=Haplochromis burtoni TaxID=8153 RepID=A0A3Q2VL96_HAPBU